MWLFNDQIIIFVDFVQKHSIEIHIIITIH